MQRGFGSGVILSRDGYILTNNHVIANADEVTVKLHDESTHKANVVGTQVEPGSLAQQAGLRLKSVIVAINSQPIANAAQLQATLSTHDLQQGVRMQVLYEGTSALSLLT